MKIKKQYGISDDKMLTIQLSIDKTGNLLSADILNSIDEKADSYMLSAIKNTSSLGKLPSLYDSVIYRPILYFGFSDLM